MELILVYVLCAIGAWALVATGTSALLYGALRESRREATDLRDVAQSASEMANSIVTYMETTRGGQAEIANNLRQIREVLVKASAAGRQPSPEYGSKY